MDNNEGDKGHCTSHDKGYNQDITQPCFGECSPAGTCMTLD